MAIQRRSDTWQAIAAWARQARDNAHIGVMTPGVDERQADFLRGQILIINELLSLPEAHITRDEED